MEWKVYLSGEIHSSWRQDIASSVKSEKLPVTFMEPVTDHGASDDCGVNILGKEEQKFWHDHKGAKINAIRSRKGIQESDIVVVRFGNQYRQWNAAFDAGYAVAAGKALIVMHDIEFQHALKEVDASALAVVENNEQLLGILRYVTTGKLKT
ncbi:MAG: YtoQ family protein [Paracoccaceae bacterium]|nr:YtoQ family protein [Paracoccaceae bacterium]